jgi:8-oxo-dGTP pyrophosphatase MutT (NUDIX family)
LTQLSPAADARAMSTVAAVARAQALRLGLEGYRARCPERADIALRMLALLQLPEAFSRQHLSPGHFTASAFVLCPERRRLLLVHHAKLERWLQPGGHIEASDADLFEAAKREVLEETGVSQIEPLLNGIFDVDIHVIPARPKEGPHEHFDVRYAFVAQSDALVVSEEVRGARWAPLAEVARLNPEESIMRCVRQLAAKRP